MRTSRSFVAGWLLFVCTGVAVAQDITAEQGKLLARRAAEADAYRKLAETVYGLQLNSRTTVRDFVAESDEIRADVDTFIKGIRLGTPTWYEDNSCEVPAEVTVAKVVETLRSAHERYYKGDDIKTSDFESITRRIDKNVIHVIGMGAPRMVNLPPDLPAGVVDLLPPPPPDLPKPSLPEIWLQVGPQARLMAIRAARVDAMRRLAERIKGLRLTSRTQVRDFVAESDEITTELNALLVGAEEVGPPYLHHDELIAEVTLRVPTEQVITSIKQLHSRHYKGDDVQGHDVEKIARTVIKRDFEATGQGVPPPEYIKRYNEQAALKIPAWAMGPLEETGEGTDPELGTPQGRLRAARAAELDAKRKLGERIAGLQLQSQTLVRDLTTQRDYISGLLDAVISGALVTQTDFTSDSARVTVAIPGMEVFGVVNDALRPAPGGAAPAGY
jgi:hypothetical protein